ncbi:MAG TPA: hypothetical protein PKI87_08525, partial [Arenimonas sp.]|nr:hypothetical protein [Arenimonas sp.]
MNWLKPFGLVFLLVAISACSHLPKEKRMRADAVALQHQDKNIHCVHEDACALKSPIYDLADQANRESTSVLPKHAVILL